jgi:bifunctional N-acetylglucosamine-1-phosphate-uridyltransferase/glucosamine-1-phosphate-acetyltransferase GlmU-like protein
LRQEESLIDRLMTDISRVTAEDDETARRTALGNMEKLYRINQRWNLAGINEFILRKQKELSGW